MSAGTGEDWGVVGGGVLGMTLALRLAQAGYNVTVVERAESLGGLATPWRLGDVVWDRHYHVTLLSDSWLRALLGELGLEQDMRWVHTRTGFYTDGQLYSMSDALEFLRFPPLGIISKLRLAATILYASRVKNWRRLEKIPVTTWLRRWSGDRTLHKLWLPLLRSKLGESYQKTSAAFIWATIDRMYAARRSGLKREMFGYLPGGYARILGAFGKRLNEENVYLMPGTTVRRVLPDSAGGVMVETGGGSRIRFDRVVLTVPGPLIPSLCPDLDDGEKDRLRGIQYQGIVCASVLLRRPLAGFYITNITEPWVPFTAVIEMSALVDREQLGGNTLVYLPRYLAFDDPSFDTPDEVWERDFMSALFRMYPELAPEDVLAFRISRERFVHALPTIGYSDRLPPRRTSIPSVFVVNSAQIVNGTLNVNETVRLAEEAVPELLAANPEHPPVPPPTEGAL